MPITSSLGSLSYSRISGTKYWQLQSIDPIEFIGAEKVGDSLLLSSTDYSSGNAIMNCWNVSTNIIPKISYELAITPAAIVPAGFTVTFVLHAGAPLSGKLFTNTSGTHGGLVVNDQVKFSGTVFGGVNTSTTYYVVGILTTGLGGITISLTPGGPSLVWTVNSSGSMTVTRQPTALTPTSFGMISKYNPYDGRLYSIGNMYQTWPGYSAGVIFTGYILKSGIDYSGITNFNHLTVLPTSVLDSGANMFNRDIIFCPTGDYIIGSTGDGKSNFTRIVQTGDTVLTYLSVWDHSATDSSTNNEIRLALNNVGETIAVTRNIITGSQGSPELKKINTTTGALIWSTAISQGSAIYDRPQSFSDMVVDSSDNIYIISEEILPLAPSNNIGGFIYKFNTAGTLIWQQHLSNVKLKGICFDGTDLYLTGYSATPNSNIYIIKMDTTGSIIWSNLLSDGTSTYNLNSSSIIVDEKIYILGNTYTIGDSLVGGSLFCLPKDGSIPHSGSYSINAVISYTLTYAVVSITTRVSNSQILAGSSYIAGSSNISGDLSTTSTPSSSIKVIGI